MFLKTACSVCMLHVWMFSGMTIGDTISQHSPWCSGSYSLSSPEILSRHEGPVLLLSRGRGGCSLPWVAVADLRKGILWTSTPVDWHVLSPADTVSLTFFLSLEPWLDLGIPPLLPLHMTGLQSPCDYPFAACSQIPARKPIPPPPFAFLFSPIFHGTRASS